MKNTSLTAIELNKLQTLIQDPGHEDWGDPVPGSKKGEFKRLATKYLRWLADGQGKVKFTPGGVAVSGEATLIVRTVYVQISANPHGILWRVTPKGGNRWLPVSQMNDRSWFDQALAESISK